MCGGSGVVAERARSAIGTKVLRDLEQEFRGKVDIMELGVRDSNEGAVSLYEREGFATVSRLEDIGFLVMRKQAGDAMDSQR
jgi:ribosomal protein S18 acetylase RimI-like enzyme